MQFWSFLEKANDTQHGFNYSIESVATDKEDILKSLDDSDNGFRYWNIITPDGQIFIKDNEK